MTVRVIPTLAAMAEVYRHTSVGGPMSPRFLAYVELGRAGVPVSGYNPMTSRDAPATIAALLDIEAEALIQEVADRWSEPLGIVDDVGLSVTVATPGMWTDRLATEIEHHLAGRTWPQILFWTEERVGVESVVAEATAQLVRVSWTMSHGPPLTVDDAAGQEGLAAALAGIDLDPPSATEVAAFADLLEIFGSDTGLGPLVAALSGDEAARTMGWGPLGLTGATGLRCSCAAAEAALAHTPIGALIAARWSPSHELMNLGSDDH